MCKMRQEEGMVTLRMVRDISDSEVRLHCGAEPDFSVHAWPQDFRNHSCSLLLVQRRVKGPNERQFLRKWLRERLVHLGCKEVWFGINLRMRLETIL